MVPNQHGLGEIYGIVSIVNNVKYTYFGFPHCIATVRIVKKEFWLSNRTKYVILRVIHKYRLYPPKSGREVCKELQCRVSDFLDIVINCDSKGKRDDKQD